MRRLERDGVITGYHAVIDRQKVGLDVLAFVRVDAERNRGDVTRELVEDRLPALALLFDRVRGLRVEGYAHAGSPSLRQELDAVTERWGMKVTNVEIREIVPPPMVQEAMIRQMVNQGVCIFPRIGNFRARGGVPQK